MNSSHEDWFVPGPAIALSDRTLRLRPPPEWTRLILDVPRTPPSMNTDQSRAWRSFYEHKRTWQSEIGILLMEQRCSRDYQRAVAGMFMRFPVRKKRRDAGNFTHITNKALGDALVEYGAIPDDDPAHYVFGGVEFEEETGPARTRIFIFFQPKEE